MTTANRDDSMRQIHRGDTNSPGQANRSILWRLGLFPCQCDIENIKASQGESVDGIESSAGQPELLEKLGAREVSGPGLPVATLWDFRGRRYSSAVAAFSPRTLDRKFPAVAGVLDGDFHRMPASGRIHRASP
jgi:hypothetical protein